MNDLRPTQMAAQAWAPAATDRHPQDGGCAGDAGAGARFGILGATLSAPTVAMVLRVRQRITAFQTGEVSRTGGGFAAGEIMKGLGPLAMKPRVRAKGSTE